MVVLVTLVLATMVRIFLVAPFYIPSSSMEDTLHVGDRVLVDRIGYHLHPIRRGDV
ncbi:MAG: signal peptidase, partial [Actinomycetota bacterium]|nr:signal peptidase [Actinomycetota bacterium]